ncbi:trypsin-like peptidase domain-containing protein [Streptomyces sp. ET3-23]|uniref:S1C family serine protease n=1 Tax=Streptomyces sp. ET3-23 TaxID=2885643 RepID=UPI001D125A27|nr:trypsin-like peptidase domain-containing protein [Streptomyces sp. ET3-23]MCC2274919.1 trypsin-like peptidase domain-containing protein [Streptomyces sp. ET3-23]
MSTENEGAAVPSAAGPGAGSPTPDSGAGPVPPVPAEPPAVGAAAPTDAPHPAEFPTAQASGGAHGDGAQGAAVAYDAAAQAQARQAAAADAHGGTAQMPSIPADAAAVAPGAPGVQMSKAEAPGGAPQADPYGAPAPGAPMGAAPHQSATGAWYGGPDGPQGPYGGTDPWGAPVPQRKRGGGLVAAVLAAALIAGGVGGGVGYWAANRTDNAGSTTVSAAGDPKVESRSPGSVADIASKALPSVVTIEAQSNNGDGGTGTGFVYDKQGHILTNNHVVAAAADGGKLQATFSDGKSYDAEVVGRAQGYDVAVIKLKNPSGARLNPLPLGDSDKAAVGDATVAIGAPFGLSGTVTTGIVSAKKRPVASSDGGGSGQASYMSALQTDASINPGNSGGPLLNAQGAVIGINSAIQSAGNGGGFGGGQGQSGSIGLGFAIPINQARNVAEQLIKNHVPTYPVISATVNMKDSGNGAKIAANGANGSPAVTPGGPADKAGLKPGDVITKLDETKIDSGPTLISEIWTHQPGDKVTVTYIRDGKQATTEITLGERKGDS